MKDKYNVSEQCKRLIGMNKKLDSSEPYEDIDSFDPAKAFPYKLTFTGIEYLIEGE